MQKKNQRQVSVIWIVMIVLALVLTACAPAATPTPAPTQDVALIQTEAAQTVVADMTQNAPAPTEAPPATAAPTAEPTTAPAPGPTPDPNIPVAVVPTPAPGEPTAVANYNTIIYSGPGQNYVVYSTLLGGSAAQVVGKSEDGLWWAVSVPVATASSGNGWVEATWVTASNVDSVPVLPTPPVPPTTELVPPEAGDPQATAIANVYVRTGPATNFPAYGVAVAGGTARVLGVSEDGQWWVVRLDPQYVGAGYGWVDGAYTTAQNVEGVPVVETPDASTTTAPPPPPEGVPTATALEAVNVRSGPGTNYPVLFVAPAGATGEVSGKSSDGAWWQVKISTEFSADGFGWVSADWVVTQNTENVPVVEAPAAPPPVEATPPPSSSSAAACALVSQVPADGTAIPMGTSFSTTWVIQNTSTTKWDANEFDVVFMGAYNNVYLHTGPDGYDLPVTVEPGATVNITIPMLAPFSSGAFGEMWQIMQGSQAVCPTYVYIAVP